MLESIKIKTTIKLSKCYKSFNLIAWLVLNALFLVEYFINIQMVSSSLLFSA